MVLSSVCGLSSLILVAAVNSLLVSGVILFVGACSHAPAPVPVVDRCTHMLLWFRLF